MLHKLWCVARLCIRMYVCIFILPGSPSPAHSSLSAATGITDSTATLTATIRDSSNAVLSGEQVRLSARAVGSSDRTYYPLATTDGSGVAQWTGLDWQTTGTVEYSVDVVDTAPGNFGSANTVRMDANSHLGIDVADVDGDGAVQIAPDSPFFVPLARYHGERREQQLPLARPHREELHIIGGAAQVCQVWQGRSSGCKLQSGRSQ